MADLITYRDAVAEGLAREMRRDPAVVCLGEDIGAAGGQGARAVANSAGASPV